MFYGNINRVEESTIDYTYDYFYAESVVTAEYNNRCAMLEACTDPDQKVVLEAQCEILKEVSIKDALKNFKEFVKKQLLKLIAWLKGLLKKGKENKFKNTIIGLLDKAENALSGIKKEDATEKDVNDANKAVGEIADAGNKAVEENKKKTGEDLGKTDVKGSKKKK